MLSIIVTAVALFAFGAVWYTFLFGSMWQRLMNFTPEDMERGKAKGMASPMILNFILGLISAGVLYWLFPVLLATSFANFVKTVVIIWIGFSFPIYANQALWEMKSWKLVALNSVQGVLYFIIGSTIIYFMQ